MRSTGSLTRSSARVFSKFVMTMKKAISWNTMSIIGVMFTSATFASRFLIRTAHASFFALPRALNRCIRPSLTIPTSKMCRATRFRSRL